MINAGPLILPILATLMAPTVDAERPTYPIIDNNGETIGHVTVQAASGGVLLGITDFLRAGLADADSRAAHPSRRLGYDRGNRCRCCNGNPYRGCFRAGHAD